MATKMNIPTKPTPITQHTIETNVPCTRDPDNFGSTCTNIIPRHASKRTTQWQISMARTKKPNLVNRSDIEAQEANFTKCVSAGSCSKCEKSQTLLFS